MLCQVVLEIWYTEMRIGGSNGACCCAAAHETSKGSELLLSCSVVSEHGDIMLQVDKEQTALHMATKDTNLELVNGAGVLLHDNLLPLHLSCSLLPPGEGIERD